MPSPPFSLHFLFSAVLVDIWSVGCIMGEMVRHKILFPGRDCILMPFTANDFSLVRYSLTPTFPSKQTIYNCHAKAETRSWILGACVIRTEAAWGTAAKCRSSDLTLANSHKTSVFLNANSHWTSECFFLLSDFTLKKQQPICSLKLSVLNIVPFLVFVGISWPFAC